MLQNPQKNSIKKVSKFIKKETMADQSSKVQKNNMSCECALNFDQWKKFSENYKPMRV